MTRQQKEYLEQLSSIHLKLTWEQTVALIKSKQWKSYEESVEGICQEAEKKMKDKLRIEEKKELPKSQEATPANSYKELFRQLNAKEITKEQYSAKLQEMNGGRPVKQPEDNAQESKTIAYFNETAEDRQIEREDEKNANIDNSDYMTAEDMQNSFDHSNLQLSPRLKQLYDFMSDGKKHHSSELNDAMGWDWRKAISDLARKVTIKKYPAGKYKYYQLIK